MELRGIIWLDDIVDKLEWKHSVRQYEVEEALYGRRIIYLSERGYRVGEDVYVAFGQTEAGRYLAVVFIHKLDSRALILSARDMSRSERRRYARR